MFAADWRILDHEPEIRAQMHTPRLPSLSTELLSEVRLHVFQHLLQTLRAELAFNSLEPFYRHRNDFSW